MMKAPMDDLADIELGEGPNGIEVFKRFPNNHHDSKGDVDGKEPTPESPDIDCEAGDTANPPSKESSEKNHGLWLFSKSAFSYFHTIINAFVILSIVLQLILIAVKTKTIKHVALLSLVALTSIINSAVAIYVLYGQYLFTKVPRLRKLINMLRMEVNRMMVENNLLSHNITQLEQEQVRLNAVEVELNRIVTTQGGNVEQFRQLVQENGNVIKRQKQILKDQWKQEIITTVLRTDQNGDFVITDTEVDMLLLRIQSLEKDAGMKMSVEESAKLRRILTTGMDGGRIGSVRALVKLIEVALDVNGEEDKVQSK